MTRKKLRERAYLDCFCKGVGWPSGPADVEEGEEPDFVVTLGSRRIGIEVTQVFADQAPRKSKMREHESRRASWLQELERDYLEAGGTPVRVQLIFSSSRYLASIARGVPPEIHQRIIDRLLLDAMSLSAGGSLTSRLRGEHQQPQVTMITTALPPSYRGPLRWRLLNDHTAWVPDLSREHIDHLVAKKASKLAAYRRKVSDVALVIVADGRFASGMVGYSGGVVPAHGFEAAYLLLFPSDGATLVAGHPIPLDWRTEVPGDLPEDQVLVGR